MNTNQTTQQDAPMWAIVELMGHNKTGALVSKDTQLGTALLRLDVPGPDGKMVTQLVNPSSIYRMTFCDEALARAAAKAGNAMPYTSWEVERMTSRIDAMEPPMLSYGGDAADDEPILDASGNPIIF